MPGGSVDDVISMKITLGFRLYIKNKKVNKKCVTRIPNPRGLGKKKEIKNKKKFGCVWVWVFVAFGFIRRVCQIQK